MAISAARPDRVYRLISHRERWHVQAGWNEQVHAAPRQMLIPARHTAMALTGHDTAQPPQPVRAGITQACRSNHAAPASVDAAMAPAQSAPISPAGQAERRMKPPIMAKNSPLKCGRGVDGGSGRGRDPDGAQRNPGFRMHHVVKQKLAV